MGLVETLIFYLLIGTAVGVAVFLSDANRSFGDQAFRTSSAILFWPVYLPVLLGRSRRSKELDESTAPAPPTDELSRAISQVETELDAALKSLDGWAENVLSGEQHRLEELRAAWHLQARRIRELDELLNQPEFLAGADESEATEIEGEFPNPSDRRLRSLQARHENIDRLRQVRRQLHDDLLGTLAWVRELVTMIHLAKFTGAPASRAEELISQIAASVEGLSEVSSWKNESLVSSL